MGRKPPGGDDEDLGRKALGAGIGIPGPSRLPLATLPDSWGPIRDPKCTQRAPRGGQGAPEGDQAAPRGDQRAPRVGQRVI